MGQSGSGNKVVVNSNHEEFIVKIKQFDVDQPNFEDLKSEFKNRFSLIVWNQLLWSINESILSYKNNGDYMSWKSAFNAIYGLKITVIIICLFPFFVSLASIVTCIFLIFIWLFLTATGIDSSSYIWRGTYNMLSPQTRVIILICYIVAFIGCIILYFTQRSLKPLKKAYTINIAKYISNNLNILNKIYQRTAQFEMKWIKYDTGLSQCNCKGIQLSANIEITILAESVDPIEDELVMDLFSTNNIAESSQSDDFVHDILNSPYDYGGGGRNRAESYGYYPVEGPDEGDIQTDISIEIIPDDDQQ